MRNSTRLALGFALAATFIVSLGTGFASANGLGTLRLTPAINILLV